MIFLHHLPELAFVRFTRMATPYDSVYPVLLPFETVQGIALADMGQIQLLGLQIISQVVWVGDIDVTQRMLISVPGRKRQA